MNILGLNAYHGDASACIVKDGKVISACEEERLNRIKHCAGFPSLAIQSCLKESNLTIDDIDFISISRNPKANLSKKIFFTIKKGAGLSHLIKSRIKNAARIISLKDEIKNALNLSSPPRAKIENVEHHLAHMASAFYPSPFDQAAILSIDGFGDFVSTKWGVGNQEDIQVLGQVEFPHSMGVLYTAITQYLGFPHYGDEYKVMGLASYGKPLYMEQFKDIVKIDEKKGFELNLDYFIHHTEGVEMNWEKGYPELSTCFSSKLVEIFGPSRKPKEETTDHHRNIASSLQKTFEEVYFHILNMLYEKTQTKNLCLAGGCALNGVANGQIHEKTPFENIYIQPAAADSGTSIGSALYVEHAILKNKRKNQMKHAYLGPAFSSEQIKKTLEENNLTYKEFDNDSMLEKTAQSLSEGKIIGWFQDEMEFGPRALGNRSLIADPRKKEMKDILNSRIKRREGFRPFAPSILEENINDYFEHNHLVPFMTQVYKVKKEKREQIPAVTHIDGTGRLQTVNKETNPKYWNLINTFKELTGVPVLLNTSFNENEPIVCTPQDAINCFQRADMDCLAIDHFWVEKS